MASPLCRRQSFGRLFEMGESLHAAAGEKCGNWPAGDCYLVYPGNLSSLRFEKLRDGLEEFEKVNILRARAAKNPKAKAAVARMDEELSKLFTVEKSRGDSHEEDVRKAREIIRKTTEISR